jgi:hypothetical protein
LKRQRKITHLSFPNVLIGNPVSGYVLDSHLSRKKEAGHKKREIRGNDNQIGEQKL